MRPGKHTVLIVDDQMVNIRLLERKLEQAEINVITATNGREGIDQAIRQHPHVILLDIMMPGMDGFEVCRTLKKDNATASIPIIFITAKDSREGKIEGLNYGAADYITKPIDLDETLARVRTQLRIVDGHNKNLELTRRLEEARRQAALVHLTEGIAHNLNNLLGVAVGYADLIPVSKDPEMLRGNCQELRAALMRMGKIALQLTRIGQFDSVNTRSYSFSEILENGIAQFTAATNQEPKVDVKSDVPTEFNLETNAELLAGTIEQLLTNARESYLTRDMQAGGMPVLMEISIEKSEFVDHMIIDVIDRGCGIAESIRDNVFDPFVSTRSGVGRGMGLTIARHSMRSLGGDIELIAEPGGGTRARITHPIA